MLKGVVVGGYQQATSSMARFLGKEPRRKEHYEEDVTWDQAIGKSLGEIAVAQWTNRYWTGARYTGERLPDVGKNIEVRWTPYRTGHLVVYGDEPREAPYVLTTGRGPKITLLGWLYGTNAMHQGFWRDTNVKAPSYWVAQSFLFPMHDLVIL